MCRNLFVFSKAKLAVLGFVCSLFFNHVLQAQDCGCTHTIVPAKGTITFDGNLQNPKVKPGDVLCFQAGAILERIILKNLVGTKDNPIIIKNCGGVAEIKGVAGASYNTVLIQYSAHLKMTGTGDDLSLYGIKVSGGSNGISFSELTTDIEVDHVEVLKTGFAGIMAKTDPVCSDSRTWRENFTMYNVKLHHNYIHDVNGEGFYVGNSFYVSGHPGTAACPITGSTETFKKYAHIIDGVDIYNNTVKRAGCEGIQVGSAPKNCKIHDNVIDTSGIFPFAKFQNNGLQIGNGTGGLVYNNFIRFSPGNGISCLGIGDNFLYNNVIINSGATDSTTGNAIFMDEQATPDSVLGKGMKFINNTIINPKDNGVRIYNDRISQNVIANNLIVHYGNSPVFIKKLNSSVLVDEKTNLFLTSIPANLFVNPILDDYRIKLGSAAAGTGTNPSNYGITFDLNNYPRKTNDIGAFATGSLEQPLAVTDNDFETGKKQAFYVYPNPISETTDEVTFQFLVAESAEVFVQIYDIQGKMISTFPSRNVQAGWNEWKTPKMSGNISSGAVVFKLVVDGKIQEGQIVILK